MKLTVVLLTVVFLSVSAKSYTQTVTYKAKDVTLEKLFAVIKDQTGFAFFYNDEDLKTAKPVTVAFSNTPLATALDQSLKNQPFHYNISGKTIFIAANATTPDKNIVVETSPDNATIDVHGVVKDEAGKPIAGVAVRVKGINKGTTTNESGEFILTKIDPNATLVFSSVQMETYETKLNGRNDVSLVMKAKVSQLEDVAVQVNTGYQTIPKERATGSFVHVDNALINRSVSTNILDRINGVTSGVLFTPGLAPGSVSSDNKAAISIRGRSTIYSNPNPLIILDNFPYDGDLSTINPNDVESIDILKDAAAASIWGAYSGNGVIVITTKKGKLNQPLKVSINSNVTIGEKPNLWYVPTLNSSDYVSVEQYLFSSGAYNNALTGSTLAASYISPVAVILNQQKNGVITADQATTQLNILRNQNYRTDLNRYFYRQMTNQQYAVNFSGGSAKNQYYFSAGFDNNLPSETYNSYQRITVTGNNTYLLLQDKLEIKAGFNYTQSRTITNNSGFSNNSPYWKLADDNGNGLAVPTKYRKLFTDTAGQGNLLDWNYRPLDELRIADNSSKLVNYNVNLSAKYNIVKGLNATVLYQYTQGRSSIENYRSQQSFFTRDLINSFSQLNYVTSTLSYRIPLGGIDDFSDQSFSSQQFRGVINYSHSWKGDHYFTAIAGMDVKSYSTQSRTSRLYGYNKDLQTFSNVDYVTSYPKFSTLLGGSSVIASNISNLGTSTNFISYFANAAYTFKSRYTASISARKDGSNIFGVSTNEKTVPLWSAGFKWTVNKESFYNVSWLPNLALRVTDGYNANSNNSISALTTLVYANAANQWGAAQASLQNPPNPSLRWEKINMVNIGIDFGFRKDVINGSIEYYHKKGTDILGNGPIAPQTGLMQFFGNIADMKGDGFDLVLNSKNVSIKQFAWHTTFLFSYSKDAITNYKLKPANLSSFLSTSYGAAASKVNPLEGNPVYSVYSYKWAGLDATGKPQFYFNGKVSTDYAGLSSSSDYTNLSYNGPATPLVFGSLRNTFSFNQVFFSFNITYKLGYWFRNNFVTQGQQLLGNGGIGYQDYLMRWQTPGDEAKTSVPAMTYPVADSRYLMYALSDVTALKADHIRLQDVQISYEMNGKQLRHLPFSGITFYAYASNIAILWRANDKGIDPDVTGLNAFPNPRTYSAGVKVNF